MVLFKTYLILNGKYIVAFIFWQIKNQHVIFVEKLDRNISSIFNHTVILEIPLWIGHSTLKMANHLKLRLLSFLKYWFSSLGLFRVKIQHEPTYLCFQNKWTTVSGQNIYKTRPYHYQGTINRNAQSRYTQLFTLHCGRNVNKPSAPTEIEGKGPKLWCDITVQQKTS